MGVRGCTALLMSGKMKNQVGDCNDTSCKSEGVLSSCSKSRKV